MNEKAHAQLMAHNNNIKEIDDIYRNIAKIFGLSEYAFWILYTLRVEPEPLTQRQICELQYQPKQTVNSALKKLEADGYITLLHGRDQRSKQLCLTPSGAALAEKSVDLVAEAEGRALLRLSEAELTHFISLFRKFNTLLREEIQTLEARQETKTDLQI